MFENVTSLWAEDLSLFSAVALRIFVKFHAVCVYCHTDDWWWCWGAELPLTFGNLAQKDITALLICSITLIGASDLGSEDEMITLASGCFCVGNLMGAIKTSATSVLLVLRPFVPVWMIIWDGLFSKPFWSVPLLLVWWDTKASWCGSLERVIFGPDGSNWVTPNEDDGNNNNNNNIYIF